MAAGSSLLSSHTPSRPARASSASRCACQRASGTMISPVAGISGSFPPDPASSRCQGSVTTFLSLMMAAIYAFLERLRSDAPHDVDEAFCFAVAPLEVDPDQFLDHVGYLLAHNRRPDHLAYRCRRSRPRQALIAADGDLVPLRPIVLVHAEDADMAHVMMT